MKDRWRIGGGGERELGEGGGHVEEGRAQLEEDGWNEELGQVEEGEGQVNDRWRSWRPGGGQVVGAGRQAADK